MYMNDLLCFLLPDCLSMKVFENLKCPAILTSQPVAEKKKRWRERKDDMVEWAKLL